MLRPITAFVLSRPARLPSRAPPASDVPVLNPSSQDESSLHSLFSRFPLVSATLPTSTKRAYGRALDYFLAKNSSLSILFQELELVLLEYVRKCYSRVPRPRRCQELANMIRNFCILYPNQRNRYCLARRCVRGWYTNVQTRSSVTMKSKPVQTFAACLFHVNHFDSKFSLAASWAGYLRASEVLSLVWDNVAFGTCTLHTWAPTRLELTSLTPRLVHSNSYPLKWLWSSASYKYLLPGVSGVFQ